MDIAVGMPSTMPGVPAALNLAWARRAEALPFSSLGIMDRLVYPNFEPLMTLAVVAGATQRIRLITGVLIGPIRNAGIVAKQAASIDALSGGRLTLGLGIGSRADDFAAADVPIRGRGRRLEAQVAVMKRIWSGGPFSDEIGPVGPKPVRPGGPEVLLGGDAAATARRIARLADGFLGGGGNPTRIAEVYALTEAAWREEGRPGRPRLVAAAFCALGPHAAEGAGAFLRHYYGYMGPPAERIAAAALTTPEAIRESVRRFVDIGADELLLRPCIPDLDHLDRLAEVVC
jgi:alkanesulfonate monooxygenase SsuD/methylene tetrahydromethanopterin reductase-like flavin-dependent oxidoreductase (luciferase family)